MSLCASGCYHYTEAHITLHHRPYCQSRSPVLDDSGEPLVCPCRWRHKPPCAIAATLALDEDLCAASKHPQTSHTTIAIVPADVPLCLLISLLPSSRVVAPVAVTSKDRHLVAAARGRYPGACCVDHSPVTHSSYHCSLPRQDPVRVCIMASINVGSARAESSHVDVVLAPSASAGT